MDENTGEQVAILLLDGKIVHVGNSPYVAETIARDMWQTMRRKGRTGSLELCVQNMGYTDREAIDQQPSLDDDIDPPDML